MPLHSPSNTLPAVTSYLLRCLLDLPLPPPSTELAESVAKAAVHHLVAGLVLKRVSTLGDTPGARSVAKRLNGPARDVATRSLSFVEALHRLHADHLAPLSIPYLAVKGVALESRYHGTIGTRGCRDLDLLLSTRDLERLLPLLLDNGYRFLPPFDGPLGRVESRDHVRTLARLTPEVSVVSPTGALIELHGSLDLTVNGFPTDQWLARRETTLIGGLAIPVPPTSDLFVYLCYHHSRHEWSRLHWLSDINRLMSHPSFDRAQVLERARVAGLFRLVTACMELPDRIRDALEDRPEAPGDPLARDLAALCLGYAQFPSNSQKEVRFTEGQSPIEWLRTHARVFSLDWRMRDRPSDRLRLLLGAFRPHLADYLAWPLPNRWTGLYWVIRPLRLLVRAVT